MTVPNLGMTKSEVLRLKLLCCLWKRSVTYWRYRFGLFLTLYIKTVISWRLHLYSVGNPATAMQQFALSWDFVKVHCTECFFLNPLKFTNARSLRYRSRWIDSVWKSRSYAGALKENPINSYIFWKLNCHRIQSYLWNFLKSYCRSDTRWNTQEHSASLKLVRFRSWIVGAARLTPEMFSHTSPSKRMTAIFQMWFGFFSTPS